MIEPDARANLVRIAKAYAKATGSTLSAVSRKFYGKAAFLEDFGAGRCSMTFSNFDRLLGALRKNWPAGTPWPATALMLMERTARRGAVAAAPKGLFAAFQAASGKISPGMTPRA